MLRHLSPTTPTRGTIVRIIQLSILAILGGCNGSTGVDIDPAGDDDDDVIPPGDDDDDDDDTDPTDTDTDTYVTPPYDCTILPPVPANFTTLTGYSDAEDFDFDGLGFAVALYDQNLFAKNRAGDTEMRSASISRETAGTRILGTGDFVVADVRNGSLKLVDSNTQGVSTILAGLAYPNGVEVDAEDYVYVAEQNAGRLQRVNAYDPTDRLTIANGMSNPNGVIISEDGQTIYVGSFGGGMIYAIDRLGPDSWAEKRILMQNPGWDWGFDGINVDICGNVYFTEYVVGKVRRITPDGQQIDEVANLPSGWIPNLRWGAGYGGYETDKMYVSDRDQGRIFELDMGIPGKTHLLAAP